MTRCWIPMSQAHSGQLTPLFAQLRARLVPLLKRVQASKVRIDDTCLHHSFDHTKQIEFGRLVLVAMGYDFERGRLDLGPSVYNLISPDGCPRDDAGLREGFAVMPVQLHPRRRPWLVRSGA